MLTHPVARKLYSKLVEALAAFLRTDEGKKFKANYSKGACRNAKAGKRCH